MANYAKTHAAFLRGLPEGDLKYWHSTYEELLHKERHVQEQSWMVKHWEEGLSIVKAEIKSRKAVAPVKAPEVKPAAETNDKDTQLTIF